MKAERTKLLPTHVELLDGQRVDLVEDVEHRDVRAVPLDDVDELEVRWSEVARRARGQMCHMRIESIELTWSTVTSSRRMTWAQLTLYSFRTTRHTSAFIPLVWGTISW